MTRDWCDDERNTRVYLKSYTMDMDTAYHGGYDGLGHYFKDLAKSEMSHANNMQWNEVEFVNYEHESLCTLPEETVNEQQLIPIPPTPDEEIKESDARKADADERNAIAFDGLMKNQFMYH